MKSKKEGMSNQILHMKGVALLYISVLFATALIQGFAWAGTPETAEGILSQADQESIEQLKDNYEALKNTVSETKSKLEEYQEKWQAFKDSYGSDPKFVKVINKLEKAGLSRHLKNAISHLGSIEKKFNFAEGKIKKLKEYREIARLVEPTNNPFERLERISGILSQGSDMVSTVGQALPGVGVITTMIGAYAQAASDYSRALKRVEKKIQANMRQGCLTIEQLKTSDDESLRSLYRMPSVQEGIMVCRQKNKRLELLGLQPYVLVGSNSDEGMLYVFVSGKWFVISSECVSDILQLWRLAYGNGPIQGVTLAGYCSPERYQRLKAMREKLKGIRKDGMCNIVQDNFCMEKIMSALHRLKEMEEICQQDEDGKLEALYLLKASFRKRLDSLFKGYSNHILFSGTVKSEDGALVAGASVHVKGTTQSTNEQGQFEILLPGRLLGSAAVVRATKKHYESGRTEVRFSYRCKNLYRPIILKKKLKSIVIEPGDSGSITLEKGAKLNLKGFAIYEDETRRNITRHKQARWEPGNRFKADKPGRFRVTLSFKDRTTGLEIIVKEKEGYRASTSQTQQPPEGQEGNRGPEEPDACKNANSDLDSIKSKISPADEGAQKSSTACQRLKGLSSTILSIKQEIESMAGEGTSLTSRVTAIQDKASTYSTVETRAMSVSDTAKTFLDSTAQLSGKISDCKWLKKNRDLFSDAIGVGESAASRLSKVSSEVLRYNKLVKEFEAAKDVAKDYLKKRVKKLMDRYRRAGKLKDEFEQEEKGLKELNEKLAEMKQTLIPEISSLLSALASCKGAEARNTVERLNGILSRLKGYPPGCEVSNPYDEINVSIPFTDIMNSYSKINDMSLDHLTISLSELERLRTMVKPRLTILKQLREKALTCKVQSSPASTSPGHQDTQDENPIDSAYLAAQNMYGSREQDRQHDVNDHISQDISSDMTNRTDRPSLASLGARLAAGLNTIRNTQGTHGHHEEGTPGVPETPDGLQNQDGGMPSQTSHESSPGNVSANGNGRSNNRETATETSAETGQHRHDHQNPGSSSDHGTRPHHGHNDGHSHGGNSGGKHYYIVDLAMTMQFASGHQSTTCNYKSRGIIHANSSQIRLCKKAASIYESLARSSKHSRYIRYIHYKFDGPYDQVPDSVEPYENINPECKVFRTKITNFRGRINGTECQQHLKKAIWIRDH